MKLSIIVPVYNCEAYLNECLDSILNQTFRDFELILVNDGSLDSSPAICNGYASKNKNISVINLENGGQGRARNFGIEAAKGEYLGFVDSDDYISSDMYEKLIDILEENAADIACCDYERFFIDGSTRYEPAKIRSEATASAGSACNKIFKRSLIGDIRFPQGLWYEDFNFSAKLLLISQKTVFINEALYFYRNGQLSTMTNKNAGKNLDIIAIMEDLRDFAKKHDRTNDFEVMLLNHVLIDSVNRVCAMGFENSRDVVRKLIDYVHEVIPDLSLSGAYKSESRNRKIIMKLNYNYMPGLSSALLKAKARV